MKLKGYSEIIKQLKSAILASRYKAAVVANKELLALYFNVGQLITEKEKQGKWGDKILMQLSTDLQHELPGLKGFSATNIKRMKLFYQQWNFCFAISPTPSDQLQKRTKKVATTMVFLISPTPSDQLQKKSKKQAAPDKVLIGQSSTDQFSPTLSDQFIQHFFTTSFSHHYELLIKTKTLEERQFYIESSRKVAISSLPVLSHHRAYRSVHGGLLEKF